MARLEFSLRDEDGRLLEAATIATTMVSLARPQNAAGGGEGVTDPGS
jgi:hypothetical protein